jgi:hypothetical protein
LNKQIKILLGLILVAIVGFGIFFLVSELFLSMMQIQGVASLLFLLVFVVVIFRTRDKSATLLTVTAFLFSFFGMLMDTWGNAIYNKPLEWLFRSQGQLLITQEINQYAPGHYTSSNELVLLLANGQQEQLSIFILYAYRFFQYLLLYLVIGYLLRKIPVKVKTTKNKEEIKSDVLTEAEKMEVQRLIKSGDKIKAIKLVKDKSGLSIDTCKRYVEWLEQEMD